jgi:hypothetical protein
LALAAEGGGHSLGFAAKWCIESYRGSQRCSQRWGRRIYEEAPLIGTNIATDKNLLLTASLHSNHDDGVARPNGKWERGASAARIVFF